MRIIFIGSIDFSRRLLEKLISMGAEIVGVVTKESSSYNDDFADLMPVAKRRGIAHRYVSDVNDRGNAQWIKSLRPDVIFCFGFSQMLKKDVIGIPPMGVVGFHPASLPANRGRHPLIWALALGLKKIAATFYFMDEGADSGDIISQEDIGVADSDNAHTLYLKVIDSASRQVEAFFPSIVRRDVHRIPQDASKATYWRKRVPRDGELDFRMGKKALYNLVRALTHPYCGAHVVYKGNFIKVWESEHVHAGSENNEPGKVLDVSDDGILVRCYDGALLLKKHDFKSLPNIGEYLL